MDTYGYVKAMMKLFAKESDEATVMNAIKITFLELQMFHEK